MSVVIESTGLGKYIASGVSKYNMENIG